MIAVGLFFGPSIRKRIYFLLKLVSNDLKNLRVVDCAV